MRIIRCTVRNVIEITVVLTIFIIVSMTHYVVTYDGSPHEPALLPEVPVRYQEYQPPEGGDVFVSRPSSINHEEFVPWTP